MLTAAVFYCFHDEVKNTLMLIYTAFFLGVIPYVFLYFQLNIPGSSLIISTTQWRDISADISLEISISLGFQIGLFSKMNNE